MEAEIGIIGGSGTAPLEELEGKEEVKVHTPYGRTSDLITLGMLAGRAVAILPRHGRGHSIQPSHVNSRANIWALKELGVTRILASSAVGSLQDGLEPGTFVFVDQFIDRTRGREQSFYTGNKVCHISVAEPFCRELRGLLEEVARGENLAFRGEGTYVCVEGPRFSTRAESRLFRQWGGDVIGMTLVPEVVLAREAEICYSSIGMVTDYDTFKEQAVSIEGVLETMKMNEEKVKKLLINVIQKIPKERGCECGNALKGALL